MIQEIPGGVCAAAGFRASGVHCGLKRAKKDLALVAADVPCAAAAVYTTNVVKAAPLHVTKRHLKNGRAQALILNSGNANASAADGEKNATTMCRLTAKALGIAAEDVAVASTGVIGVSLTPKMDLLESGIKAAAAALTNEHSGSYDAATACMTTDLVQKEFAVSVEIGGKTVHIGSIAKGSGMMHPNMGTMLACITTDAAIAAPLLESALQSAVRQSFNRVSVDGDTSTNDFCLILASGYAGNAEITAQGEEYEQFLAALTAVCIRQARALAADGEGATHLITCRVAGAETEEIAERVARQVTASSLVKTAIFGRDANWGRIICAMGYAGVDFDPERVSISFQSEAGQLLVCDMGRGIVFDEDLALKVLTPHEIIIQINMHSGDKSCACWGCDLSYEYVKINGDYRT